MLPDLYIDEPVPHADRVERQVQRIAARWRAAPTIAVVPTADDLPVDAPDDARGLFMDGRVWVVADQPAHAIARTVAHEAVAHHGLREHLGPAWAELMSAMNDGARGNCEHLVDLRHEVRYAYGDDLHPAELADEMAAGIVERGVNLRNGQFEPENPLRKRATAALAHFQREWLYRHVPAGYDEIEGHLLAAQRYLQRGRASALGRWLHRWYPRAMHKPMGASIPPRDLAESARWLKAERDKDFSSAAGSLVLGVLIMLASICSFGWYLLSRFF